MLDGMAITTVPAVDTTPSSDAEANTEPADPLEETVEHADEVDMGVDPRLWADWLPNALRCRVSRKITLF